MPADEQLRSADSRDTFACLTYHIVGGQPAHQYQISCHAFVSQVRYLNENGYTVESLEHLERRIHSESPFPTRYVTITVDDGHKSSMSIADVLTSFGFSATFCIVRDKSQGHEGYIRPAQIRDLQRAGFSIASHGVTHRKLSKLARPECVRELRDSKLWLEDVLGREVSHFIAPGGYFNSQVTKLAFAEGYSLFGTCTEDMNRPSRLKLRRLLNRVNIRAHFSMDDFRAIIEGHRLFYWRRQARAAVLAIPKVCLHGEPRP